MAPYAIADEPEGQASDRTEEARDWASERTDEAGDWAGETGDAIEDAVNPDRTRLTGRTLTSTDLEYEDGSAPISDLRMSADGQVEALVVSHGGFLGVFGDEIEVDAVSATVERGLDNGEIRVEADLREADMEAAAAGERSAMALELAEERSETALYYSDLSGAEIHGADGEAVAVIRDIEFSEDGAAEHVVVRDNGFFNMLGETGRLPFSSLSVEHDGEEWGVHARSVTETDIERIASSDDDAR